MDAPRESVVVEREPYGASVFVTCHAEFEIEGTVIIRALGWDDREIARFAPGTWRSVRGVGAGGVDLYYALPCMVHDLARRLPRSA